MIISGFPPSEADKARMLAEAEESHAARAAHRQAVEARRIGTLAMVEPGVEVWSRFGDEPRGGVVVEVGETVVLDTGEVVRRFVALNPYEPDHRWEAVIPEDEVLEDGVTIPTTARLVKIARRLAGLVAKGGNVATTRDLDHARWLERLLVKAMGLG